MERLTIENVLGNGTELLRQCKPFTCAKICNAQTMCSECPIDEALHRLQSIENGDLHKKCLELQGEKDKLQAKIDEKDALIGTLMHQLYSEREMVRENETILLNAYEDVLNRIRDDIILVLGPQS